MIQQSWHPAILNAEAARAGNDIDAVFAAESDAGSRVRVTRQALESFRVQGAEKVCTRRRTG